MDNSATCCSVFMLYLCFAIPASEAFESMRMMPFLMPLIWILFHPKFVNEAYLKEVVPVCCRITFERFVYINKSDCGIYDKKGRLIMVLHDCHFERNHDSN